MNRPFADFDFTDFWDENQYYKDKYTDDPITDKKVAAVEEDLGYKLPQSYIVLAMQKNGGAPRKTSHHTSEPTSWAKDHIAITGIYSIGSAKTYSLSGEFSSKFWVSEWEYPPLGVYFADCPSAGHDMLCLDYRACGPMGEPTVVHVDQERDYTVTFVADNFEAFIRGLKDEAVFEEN